MMCSEGHPEDVPFTGRLQAARDSAIACLVDKYYSIRLKSLVSEAYCVLQETDPLQQLIHLVGKHLDF